MTAETDADAERRRELADFLRTRRERLAPEDVGLPRGGRRRVVGLRREELAQLAGVGLTWYTWLEQARNIHVSRQVVHSLGLALRLDPTQRSLSASMKLPASVLDKIHAIAERAHDRVGSPAQDGNATREAVRLRCLGDNPSAREALEGRRVTTRSEGKAHAGRDLAHTSVEFATFLVVLWRP